jgi:hypothetical protein
LGGDVTRVLVGVVGGRESNRGEAAIDPVVHQQRAGYQTAVAQRRGGRDHSVGKFAFDRERVTLVNEVDAFDCEDRDVVGGDLRR